VHLGTVTWPWNNIRKKKSRKKKERKKNARKVGINSNGPFLQYFRKIHILFINAVSPEGRKIASLSLLQDEPR